MYFLWKMPRSLSSFIIAGKALSPKWLILDTRDHLLNLHSSQPSKSNNKLLILLKKLDSFLLKELLLKESPSLHPDQFKRSSSELVNKATKSNLGIKEDALLAGEVMGCRCILVMYYLPCLR
jgi:hypothetical protein